ncbi:hypothetical protein RJ639_012930 [Escallonia herrerae]|uniref:Late embryogenesis abundant protein LEA-2 subgroup domain-containing protein n=1 Tax=Escallonia herrerae TaxID=1293975 RepID=A0AA89AR02_9ASTE|nr:hypothetical protein RJ639_012930 [Escallonia herrerae]
MDKALVYETRDSGFDPQRSRLGKSQIKQPISIFSLIASFSCLSSLYFSHKDASPSAASASTSTSTSTITITITTTTTTTTPPPQRRPTLSPLNQIVVSNQSFKQQTFPPDAPFLSTRKPIEKPILRQPRRTNPIVWCGAIFCLVFSLLLIFFGIVTLIIFLVVKPRNPVFDTPNASLNVIYFDSPEYFNGDFTFLANFSNPNRKLDVRFEYLDIGVYFSDNLIAAHVLQPFSQRQGETRLVSVRLISSLVYLPPSHAMKLQKEVQSNRLDNWKHQLQAYSIT